MPAKEVRIPNKVGKEINRLPKRIRERVLPALEKLKKEPLLGFKLRGKLEEYCKFRIGDYRIVYRYNEKTKILDILKVEHRQGVYR